MNNFIEMFSGIGGMGYGLMQAGWNCVGYAEIDKYAHQAYEILHDPEKRMWNAYDVKSVTDDDLRLLGSERGPIQLLAGGFPCQSFSIAGKRQGFTDATRGTLFFEIIRWASILRPEHLLLENVTGLLNHDEGRTFQTVIGSLDELGYVGEWCVLNSSAYVPQNRERIFIVASLRGSSRPQVFPFGSENSGVIEVVGKLEGNHDQNSRVYGVAGIAPTLGTMQGGGQEPKIMVVGSLEYYGNDQMNRVYDVKGLAPTLNIRNSGNEPKVLVVGNTNPSGNGMNGQVYDAGHLAPTLTTNKGEGNKILLREPVAVLTPDREEKRQNGRRFKEPGEPSFTLTAQDKHGIYDGYRIRKLTPLECFRLQSYPDEWYHKLKTAGISDSQLYKMAGNGVTSVVAYEIGKRLINT